MIESVASLSFSTRVRSCRPKVPVPTRVHEDGTKAARPEHPGDEGVKERSARTVCVTPEQADAIAPAQKWPLAKKRSFQTEASLPWNVARSKREGTG